MLIDEKWRPIAGHPSYEVSDQGRVRSLDRVITCASRWGGTISYRKPGRILRPVEGRPQIQLGQGNTYYVHTLVLTAFIGPRPEGTEGCHKDGNRANNHLSNLRWDTRGENNRDAVRHGTHFRTRTKLCPRGHELQAPNLQPGHARHRRRQCWACSITSPWGRQHGIPKSDARWLAEADRRYAEICHFGSPIRYNTSGREERWTPLSA